MVVTEESAGGRSGSGVMGAVVANVGIGVRYRGCGVLWVMLCAGRVLVVGVWRVLSVVVWV